MRIDVQRYTERFGSVRLNDVQRVLELDSGRANGKDSGVDIATINISDDVSRDIEEKMAIAIMVKDEKLKLFEGVVSGVPHNCLIIVVSNSKRKRVDRFRMERDALFQFSRFTRRPAMIIHQKDPALAQALGDAGYGPLLDEDGLLRSGKSEGMIAAMLLAKLSKKDYIGFVDADNYFPGAVWEYAKAYAAGFSMATSPYAMVRILWRYKPKVSEGMYFRRYGRVSEISNKYMNTVISTATGFETDIIKTSNAGEHAPMPPAMPLSRRSCSPSLRALAALCPSLSRRQPSMVLRYCRLRPEILTSTKRKVAGTSTRICCCPA
jgi:mannosyl-3-phosphoglycerate synthase